MAVDGVSKQLQDEREILMAGLKLGEELSVLRDTNSELRERVQRMRQENAALQALAQQSKQGGQSLSSTQSTGASLGSTLSPENEEQLLLHERNRLKDEHRHLKIQHEALIEEAMRLTQDLSYDASAGPMTPPRGQSPPRSPVTGASLCDSYSGLRREHANLRHENERLRNELSAFDWNLDEIPDGSEELCREVLAAMLRASFFPGTSPRRASPRRDSPRKQEALSARWEEVGGFESVGSNAPANQRDLFLNQEQFPPPEQANSLNSAAQAVAPTQAQAAPVAPAPAPAAGVAPKTRDVGVQEPQGILEEQSRPPAPEPKKNIKPEQRASATREELEKLAGSDRKK